LKISEPSTVIGYATFTSWATRFLENRVRQRSQQQRNLPVALNLAELALDPQLIRADPALNVVSGAPLFYVAANRLHDGESRLDHVRAGQSATQLGRHPQTVDREGFFHAIPRLYELSRSA
jgi:hypothetical protein